MKKILKCEEFRLQVLHTYVGRIQETGIWVLQYELIGQMSESKSAQVGHAACP